MSANPYDTGDGNRSSAHKRDRSARRYEQKPRHRDNTPEDMGKRQQYIEPTDSFMGPQTRKPKGSSKGKVGREPTEYTEEKNELPLAEYLDLNKQATLRCLQVIRMENKKKQFILEIHADNTRLSNALLQTMQHWNDNRPEKGPHPDGDSSQTLWHTFVKHCTDILSNTEQKYAAQASRLSTILQTSYIADQRHKSIIHRFSPLGRKTPPQTTPWLLVVEFNNMLSQGRHVHEEVLENIEMFKIIPSLSFHTDRGPVDQLEKRLRAARLEE